MEKQRNVAVPYDIAKGREEFKKNRKWIRWIAPCSGLFPDADMTVLVHTPTDTEPVQLGYWDGEVWRHIFTEDEIAPVVHWAEMPEAPHAP